MARVERPGLLASLWGGPELLVQRGFYCCYDAIGKTDLRCELCVPGGVVGAPEARAAVGHHIGRARAGNGGRRPAPDAATAPPTTALKVGHLMGTTLRACQS